MRHVFTLAAAGLLLAGCGDMGRTPAVVEPVPVPSAIGQQNRFVPPPGGFAGASAAARAGATTPRAAMNGTGGTGGTAAAGFVPIDDNGFASAPSPTPVPARGSATSGPNIVEYALSTTHPVGTPRYRRVNPLRWQSWERNCMRFPSQDAAQEAFLAAGGPERDRQNLDPDGDGYACWWNPEPFRRALRAGG